MSHHPTHERAYTGKSIYSDFKYVAYVISFLMYDYTIQLP